MSDYLESVRQALDRVRDGIEVLEHGRQTHLGWIEYLEDENPDFDTDLVGDAAHHRWYLEAYDAVLPAARRLIRLAETGQRIEWCGTHEAEAVDKWTCRKRARPSFTPLECHIVSKWLSDYTKEET